MTTVPQTTATAPATETSGGIAENTVAPEIESAPADESNIPGVLRHLQAGKFKAIYDAMNAADPVAEDDTNINVEA